MSTGSSKIYNSGKQGNYKVGTLTQITTDVFSKELPALEQANSYNTCQNSILDSSP